MRRVRIIHVLRPLTGSAALAALLSVLALWGIGQEVFVAHVLANMPSTADAAAVLKFFAAAFLNTRFIVQVLSVVALGAFIWLVRAIAETLGRAVRFAI